MTTRAEAIYTCRGEVFRLMPEKAVYWENDGSLIVADLHLGKAATFRAASLAVPESTTQETLARLDQCIARTSPRRLIVLGDVVHARQGLTAPLVDAVTRWRSRHMALDVEVIVGNHDQRSGALPGSWGMQSLSALHHHPPFVLRHHPTPFPGGYVLSGHLHPAVRLRPPGRGALRLPCFWFGPRVAVLPAFGSFTGMADVEPGTADSVFAIAGNEVLEVSGMVSRLR